MSELAVFRPGDGADAVAASIAEAGYAIVEGLLGADRVAGLRAEIEPHLAATQPSGSGFLGHKTKRFNRILLKSETSRGMAVDPLLLAVCDRVLLPHCARYQLNYSGVMHLEPGEQAQALHRDAFFYPIVSPCPPLVLGAIWAMTDFTAENGATRLVPGSHRWEETREVEPHEIRPAEMPAGSVLLYAHNIIHGGGENRTDTARTGVALNYSLGWLRQQENMYLAIPPEEARKLPERLQRLIGYDLQAPYMNLLDGNDPHVLLEDGEQAAPGAGRRTDAELDAANAKIRRLRVVDEAPEEGAAEWMGFRKKAAGS